MKVIISQYRQSDFLRYKVKKLDFISFEMLNQNEQRWDQVIVTQVKARLSLKSGVKSQVKTGRF